MPIDFSKMSHGHRMQFFAGRKKHHNRQARQKAARKLRLLRMIRDLKRPYTPDDVETFADELALSVKTIKKYLKEFREERRVCPCCNRPY